jgi:hypothetical protein
LPPDGGETEDTDSRLSEKDRKTETGKTESDTGSKSRYTGEGPDSHEHIFLAEDCVSGSAIPSAGGAGWTDTAAAAATGADPRCKEGAVGAEHVCEAAEMQAWSAKQPYVERA